MACLVTSLDEVICILAREPLGSLLLVVNNTADQGIYNSSEICSWTCTCIAQ